jgi:calcineurin-like phosphoesterase family protein
MTTFFTSDTHFGHARIIELSNRPFKSVQEMNEIIVHNWNALVRPDDTVYHLGDVALGPIEDSLKYISRLNGNITLIVGNHDRMFPPMQKGANKAEKIETWKQKYLAAGFSHVLTSMDMRMASSVDGQRAEYSFRLSHFPYDGDSHGEERHREYRLTDNGTALIHGHTHEDKKFSRSRAGTPQIHVGQDAWEFAPVSLQAVIDVLDSHS